ncbi:unnamed protein product [Brachionus calyciflorus]|uniref:HTH CENPB-type domain-containing protein n=1 Tax=Brachionus calyciflorus TaxID=104777 RepID=A0A814T1F0_9BILA|nr:unnamed protein product [Brachionus calyciflorus]
MDELGLKVKRNRTDLTLDIKREIIQFHKQHPKINQLHVALHFNNKYNVKIGRATISDIYASEKKLFSLGNIRDVNSKRLSSARFPLIESCLMLWISDVRARGINLSDDMLIEQAKIFGDRLGYGMEMKF